MGQPRTVVLIKPERRGLTGERGFSGRERIPHVHIHRRCVCQLTSRSKKKESLRILTRYYQESHTAGGALLPADFLGKQLNDKQKKINAQDCPVHLAAVLREVHEGRMPRPPRQGLNAHRAGSRKQVKELQGGIERNVEWEGFLVMSALEPMSSFINVKAILD